MLGVIGAKLANVNGVILYRAVRFAWYTRKERKHTMITLNDIRDNLNYLSMGYTVPRLTPAEAGLLLTALRGTKAYCVHCGKVDRPLAWTDVQDPLCEQCSLLAEYASMAAKEGKENGLEEWKEHAAQYTEITGEPWGVS